MAEKIRVMIPEDKVDARIKEIGEAISKQYEGEEVHLICVLRGGSFFMCELAKRISGNTGFYVCFQLWHGYKIKRCC